MFKRLLGKKEKKDQPDPEFKKAERMVQLASKIDKQIDINTKKVEKLEKDKERYMEAAKKAKLMKRDAQCRQYLMKVKNSKKLLESQNKMTNKLVHVSMIVDQFFIQSDGIEVLKDAVNVMETFGMDPDEAQAVSDKMADIQDRMADIDDATQEMAGDMDVDDEMDELDQLLAEDAAAMPDVAVKPVASAASPVRNERAAEEAEENFEDQLADL